MPFLLAFASIVLVRGKSLALAAGLRSMHSMGLSPLSHSYSLQSQARAGDTSGVPTRSTEETSEVQWEWERLVAGRCVCEPNRPPTTPEHAEVNSVWLVAKRCS